MRCGWDLDGVAYPFVDEFRTWAADIGAIVADCPVRYPDDCWDFPTRWGLRADVFVDIVVAGVLEGRIFADAEPLPGAVDAAWTLAGDGHQVVVVTARCFPGLDAAVVEQVTADWLDRAGFPSCELHVRADKTAVPLDTMVDDSVDNHHALLAAGVASFLLDQPWNRTSPDRDRRLGAIAGYPDAVRHLRRAA